MARSIEMEVLIWFYWVFQEGKGRKRKEKGEIIGIFVAHLVIRKTRNVLVWLSLA
jgi:hypothetical protein